MAKPGFDRQNSEPRERRRRRRNALVRLDRTIHLLDVENLTGGSNATADDVEGAVGLFVAEAEVHDADHLVAASGPTLAPLAAFAIPRGRMLIGHGIDGADKALASWAPTSWIAERYERVVLGSGDGYFADLISAVKALGVVTLVVARQGSLSDRLAASADRWVELPRLDV